MDGFGFLVSVGAFIMALVALNKISRLDTTIAQLKLQLGLFSDELSRLRQSPPEESKVEVKKTKRAAVAAKSPEPVLVETPAPAVGIVKHPEPAASEIPVPKKP